MSNVDFTKLQVKSYSVLINNPNPIKVGDKIKLPPGIVTQEQIDAALQLKVQNGDIFITSYPKTGTTWLQAVVWWIMSVQKAKAKGESVESLQPPSMSQLKRFDNLFIDVNGVAEVDKLPIPRVFVSHLPYEFVPKVSKDERTKNVAKYLHIIRDPKDAVVSYFHFFQMLFKLPDDDLEQFVDHFIHGTGIYGDYFECVNSWWKRKDDPNILILFYEEMLSDPKEQIFKIAEFLSDETVNYLNVLKNDPQVVDRIVNETTFKSMKESHSNMLKTNPNSPAPDFFRKGIARDWKNYLSESQVAAINGRIETELGQPFVDMYI